MTATTTSTETVEIGEILRTAADRIVALAAEGSEMSLTSFIYGAARRLGTDADAAEQAMARFARHLHLPVGCYPTLGTAIRDWAEGLGVDELVAALAGASEPETVPAEIPAERVKPGVGIQKVNSFDREGKFTHQVTWVGTERKARLHAKLLAMHDADPGYAELLREYQSIPR